MRELVKRVIMGPKQLFSEPIIKDELAPDSSLHVWALLLERTNPIDTEHFLEMIQPSAEKDPLIGLCTPGQSDNLTNPSSWTDRKVLDFGSDETKARKECNNS